MRGMALLGSFFVDEFHTILFLTYFSAQHNGLGFAKYHKKIISVYRNNTIR
jgi:hypothetical protein